MASYLGRNLIEALIKGDTFDRRFEQFSAAVMSERDGIDYTTTSPTGDLGRDAYANTMLASGIAVVCATTQSTKIRKKFEEDIDRLAEGPMSVARLHICASKELSEKSRDEIRNYVNQKLPRCAAEVHGATQLVDLAYRYQRPFLDHYERDLDVIDAVERRKRDEDDERENPVRLLRVALATVFSKDVIAQRDQLLVTLVLTTLEDAECPMKAQELCNNISEALRLTHAPVAGYLSATLEHLAEKAYIRFGAAGWTLTDTGREEVIRLTTAAAGRVLDGRTAFLKLLGDLESDKADARALTRVWNVIQQHLSVMFLNNGLRLIDDIRLMAAGSIQSQPSSSSLQSLRDLLGKIKRLGLPDRMSAAVHGVVIDMLTQAGSGAFAWLSELAAKYLVICALGLDPELERRIAERVSLWEVVPDTHVVLAYLSAGDDRHDQAEQLLTVVRRLNATLVVADSVLQEAVHHAELAVGEFDRFRRRVQETQRQLPRSSAYAAIETFDNAFIKGFAMESGDQFLPSEWSTYIGQFLSRGRDTTSSLVSLMLREFPGAEFTRDDSEIIEVGRIFAEKQTANWDEENLASNQTLRLQWDGRLMAMCIARRRTMAIERRLIVLTDSEGLRKSFNGSVEASKRVGITLTRPAAMAAALMLVPNTSVNLDCVRLLLFDELRIAVNSAKRAVFRANGERFLRRHGLEDRIDDTLLNSGD